MDVDSGVGKSEAVGGELREELEGDGGLKTYRASCEETAEALAHSGGRGRARGRILGQRELRDVGMDVSDRCCSYENGGRRDSSSCRTRRIYSVFMTLVGT